MNLKEIESLIKEALPDASVEIQDLAGDGNHYSATVISSKFSGKSNVELFNLKIAGFSGIELEHDQQDYIYELSFISPLNTLLYQNYPNPFKESTVIDYQLSDSGFVSLIIYIYLLND